MKIDPIAAAPNNIIASLAAAETTSTLPPAGYVPIELSTKGKVGAPAKFHIRNFRTKDVMALALTEERDLPLRIVSLLNDLIYEEGVDVALFHENEVIETMLKLYASFYSSTFLDVDFPIQESDLQYIRDKYPKKEADEKIEALLSGKWKPKCDIDIMKHVHTYELPSTFSSEATVVDKKSQFSLTFRVPLYGDTLSVRNWLSDYFAEDEKKFAPIRQKLELRERMLASYKNGESVNLKSIPYVSDSEEEQYRQFITLRAATGIDVIRALHLKKFDGEDVTQKSIAQRMLLVQDPRVDARVTKKLDKYFEELKFGVKEDVDMKNPITGEPCTRRYSFRLSFILQASQLSEDDDYEFVFSG